MDTTGEKEKRMSKKKLDGSSTSRHDNKIFSDRSMEKWSLVSGKWRKMLKTG